MNHQDSFVFCTSKNSVYRYYQSHENVLNGSLVTEFYNFCSFIEVLFLNLHADGRKIAVTFLSFDDDPSSLHLYLVWPSISFS